MNTDPAGDTGRVVAGGFGAEAPSGVEGGVDIVRWVPRITRDSVSVVIGVADLGSPTAEAVTFVAHWQLRGHSVGMTGSFWRSAQSVRDGVPGLAAEPFVLTTSSQGGSVDDGAAPLQVEATADPASGYVTLSTPRAALEKLLGAPVTRTPVDAAVVGYVEAGTPLVQPQGDVARAVLTSVGASPCFPGDRV